MSPCSRTGRRVLDGYAGTGHASGSNEESGFNTTGKNLGLRNRPMSLVETKPKDRGTILAEERTDLAVQRTLIAAERTLMAWIRKAISMIG